MVTSPTKVVGQPPLHSRLNHPMRTQIFDRQYSVFEGETFEEGMRRVASALYPNDMYEIQRLERVLLNGEAQFGGRVIAGAGTEHGNMLNCFVQAEPPGLEGTTKGVLILAKKLALVTKVGGGNGVNLDTIPGKGPHRINVGHAFLTINDEHPDYDNVRAGRYMDLARGEYVTRPYRRVSRADRKRGVPPHGIDQFLCYSAARDQYLFEEKKGVTVHQLGVPDSIEGIWDAAAQMVEWMLQGDDVYVDLSALRPEGTPVNGSGGVSSGPASFASMIFDNFARWARLGGAEHAGPVATLRYIYAPTLASIRQGGVRRGAGMATLSLDHLDLHDFITSKDLEREQLEGEIGTFNISVLTHAEDTTSDSPSQDLALVAEHAWQTGEPGLLFIDTINRYNLAVDTQGDIVATNPCGEIGLYPGEPCDLAAMNMAAFVRASYDPSADGPVVLDRGSESALGTLNPRAIDIDRLRQVTEIMVNALDRVLDVENAPLPEIREAIDKNRRIGLGFMGLADMMIRLGLPYDSKEAQDFAETLSTTVTQWAVQYSERRGRDLGVPEGVKEASPHLPRRNIAIMTVAPTGTIAMMTGVSGGVEPVFSGVTYRRIGNDYHEILHPLLVEILTDHAPAEAWDWDLIKADISAANGSIRKFIDALDDDSTVRDDPRIYAFRVAQEIHPEDHVKMQGAVQRGFDLDFNCVRTFAGNSISKTINLPHEATVEDVLQAYTLAAYEGCKGITVYRDGSRQFQVLNTSRQDEDDPEGLDPIEEYRQDMGAPAYGTETDVEVSESIRGLLEQFTEEEIETGVVERGDFVDTTQLPGGKIFPPRTEAEAQAQVEALVERHKNALDAIAKFDGPEEDDDEPDYEGYNSLVQRDNPAPGFSYKYRVAGTKTYVQVFFNNQGELVEVFTPAHKGAGSNERTSHAIIGRLMSLALKYGVPAEEIAQTLSGHLDESGGISPEVGYVGSRWEVVAIALEDAAKRFEIIEDNSQFDEAQERIEQRLDTARPQGPTCPDCGSPLVRESGCLTCHACGYSKCG